MKELIEKLLKRLVDRYEVIELIETRYVPEPDIPDWTRPMHIAKVRVRRFGRVTGEIKVYNTIGPNYGYSWKTEAGIHSWKAYGERLENGISKYYRDKLEEERVAEFRQDVARIVDKQ